MITLFRKYRVSGEHPLTRQQLEAIQRFAPTQKTVVMVVEPVVKTGCGPGEGAFASVDDISAHVQRVLVARSMIVAINNPQKVVGQVSEA